MKKILSLIFALALGAVLLVGCAVPQQAALPQKVEIQPEQLAAEPVAAGGVLRLKINPEIALHYDENGKVTKLEGQNADGVTLLKDFTGYTGKDTSLVLEELVELIGKAGYFVEEADGTARRIVLELDPGSQVPHEQFLQDMARHVKTCVENKSWVGEQEFDYPEVPAATEPAAPKATEPAAPKSTEPAKPKETVPKATVPAGLCPVCGDDDCDDGAYCDDADERAENLREAENRKNGTPCKTCGDYDCDDGAYCDDADERYERDDDRYDDDDDDDDRHHRRHHDDDDD